MSLLDLRMRWTARLQASAWHRTLVWAAVAGVLGALATLGLHHALVGVQALLYGRGDDLVRAAQQLVWWQRLLMPALGGVVAGLVLMLLARVGDARPHGDYMEAIALGDGNLGVRHSLLRALSSLATVVSGGAIGREGPMVQLAALGGSLVGRWRDMPVPRRRLMVACGAAAGVATAYNAPIAGALFVAEIVLKSLAIESLGPLLVAAFAANVTAGWLVGTAPVYEMPGFLLQRGGPTLALAMLGIVAGLVAPLFLWGLDRARQAFARLAAPPWLTLGLGGLVVGALSLHSPAAWGNGYGVVNDVLQGGWAWTALAGLLVLKVAAIAATTGSGAVGGIFTPTLFVGAVAGALCWSALQSVWPGAVPESASIAIGMGAFLAACTHAPLTSVLMIFEMTENYGVVVPLMLACVLAYQVSRMLRPASIYGAAPGPQAHAPVLTMAADLMRGDSAAIQDGQTLQALEAAFVKHRWPHVYVLDAQQRFLGSIAIHDLAAPAVAAAPRDAPWPAALLRRDHPRVRETTPLWQVLETFARHPGERLPVLDAAGRLRGHVTKTDLVLMFRERLAVA